MSTPHNPESHGSRPIRPESDNVDLTDDSSAAAREEGAVKTQETVKTDTRAEDKAAVTRSGRDESINGGSLPKFTSVGVGLLGLVLAAVILYLAGDHDKGFGQWLTDAMLPIAVLGAIIFLVLIYFIALPVEGRRRALDRLMQSVVTVFFLAALVPLGSLIFEVISRGLPRLDATFFTETQAKTYDMDVQLGGRHALMGSLITTGLATLISVPIGIFTSIYLVEYGKEGKLANATRFFVDVMTGIPSIVAGLFAYTMISLLMGPNTKIGMSAAIALSVLMIPTIVRSTEEMLRLVPHDLREASYALGVPKWLTIVRIVLPTALAGIITGVILGIARIIGETAPLLVTAGTYANENLNPMSGQMMTMPVMVYDSIRNTGPRSQEFADMGWTGALVLILLVMLLNLLGRLITWRFAPKPGR